MNYFDSTTGNGILSVYYQIGVILQKLRGDAEVRLFSLQVKHLYVGQFQYEK